MSGGDSLLLDSASRRFQDLCTDEALARAERGEWLPQHWQAIEDLGLPLALLDEASGGYGVDPLEALAVVKLAGFHALPLPLGESMLANLRLAEAGHRAEPGVCVMAPVHGAGDLVLEPHPQGWHLRGSISRVPWGRNAARFVVLAHHQGQLQLVLLPAGACAVEEGSNPAGAPRDRLGIDTVLPRDNVRPAPKDVEVYAADEAALRTLTLAGALERLLAMAVQYAGERVQFGKPIGKFQVIQQNLAVLATQACAAAAAADIAARALAGQGGPLAIAMAKSRAGEAAGIACGLAHQIHGAIGFTAEHPLHFITKLLWSARDEGGGEAYWNRQIGLHVARLGADSLWPFLTAP
jgi:acyl-CoA dehydrogenase